MGQRTAGRRRASSRVGRVGPGSLGARLLTVLLVPIIGLQVFAFREVQGHNRSAASAAQVSARVALLQYSGQLIVPLYVELTATDGIAQGEQLGLSRNVLTEAVGLNFIDMINTARAQLDESLDGLATAWPDERLPSGVTLGEEVAEIRLDLARVRAQFDAAEQRASDVTAVFARIVALVDQINSQSSTIFEQSATTRELAGIGAETEEFLQLLEYATTELRFVTEAGISAGDNDQIYGAIVTSGSFQSSLDRLRSLLEPQRREAFDTMVSGDAFERMDAALPTWVSTLVGLGQQVATVLDDPVAVELMVDTVVASFDRLTDLQSYGMTFLPEEVQRAEAIQASAERSRHDAMVVMIAAVAASLVLLGLVLISILRPLRRLARQSQLVVDGDLALAPMRPTGPTDIRVVMRTFNEMVTTLRAYDAQVRKLALGEMQIDRTLPGPLGDTLRQSVSHLATVTSRLHASEAAANVQARTDSLTGLSNRSAALEHLAKLSVQARLDSTLSAIVFLDLDGFKSINDTQGHGEGDLILGKIGARLKEACPDHLVARIGGDEFIVLIDRVEGQDEATELARYLLDIVSAPCAGTTGQMFTISASAGVALVDGHNDPLDSIAQADSAVYHAMERGRGRVEVYDARLARDIEERADMALTMRQGITGNQFSLRLQPIIDIATKEPVGAEALLRWNRPGIGEVGPNDFIPIAERTGVILDLDAWVLEQSVGILREWQQHPLTTGLRMAVNISGRNIVDGSLSPLLARLCERAEVDPSLIDLEITETHLVADVARASSVVDDLRRQGIKVAIDDFGTGYSSMSYLHQLTVDTLKIDQVFINGICDSDLDRTIVELLLRLGDSLGLKVVAEGVDSEDKLIELARMGCPMAQGFYIARPMSIADATVWLRQQVTLASLL